MFVSGQGNVEIVGLGIILKLARLRLGLSQSEIADEAGVNATRVSEIESDGDRSTVPISTYLSIAKVIVDYYNLQ